MSTNMTNLSLRVLSNSEYSRRRSFYKRQGYRIEEQWQEYAYNAVKRAIEGNDASHLNDLVFSSKDMGKYRVICRTLKSMRFHWKKLNKDTYETGNKLTVEQKARRVCLLATWESDYMHVLMAEGVHAEKAPVGWDIEKEVSRELDKCIKRQGNVIDFATAMLKAAKQYDKDQLATQAARVTAARTA